MRALEKYAMFNPIKAVFNKAKQGFKSLKGSFESGTKPSRGFATSLGTKKTFSQKPLSSKQNRTAFRMTDSNGNIAFGVPKNKTNRRSLANLHDSVKRNEMLKNKVYFKDENGNKTFRPTFN